MSRVLLNVGILAHFPHLNERILGKLPVGTFIVFEQFICRVALMTHLLCWVTLFHRFVLLCRVTRFGHPQGCDFRTLMVLEIFDPKWWDKEFGGGRIW